MTDLTTNDLSHLSDEEFNALCPQGEHAPGSEPLSPAARAVLNAFGTYPLRADHISEDLIPALAAALRAAAVDPYEIDLPLSKVMEWEKIKGTCASYYAAAKWGYEQALANINTIATELENHV